MKQDLYSVENGQVVGQIEVADHIFQNEVREHVIYEAIKAELANLRQGTAQAKERGEVKGSNAKIYRQKGTGRARAGSKKSPIWKGGGTVFGPRMRDYRIDLPKKLKHRAMVSLLSKKTGDDCVKFIANFDFESGKTGELAKLMQNVTDPRGVILVIKGNNKSIKQAVRNLPWAKCYSSNRMAYKDLFYAKKVIITQEAAEDLADHYQVSLKKAE